MLGFFVRRAIKKSLVLSSLHERSEKLISEIRKEGIDEDVARGWARQMFDHLLPALNSRDARIECRKLLVEWGKPRCVDEKDFLKANVMRTCSAPAVGANSQPVGFKSQDVIAASWILWEHAARAGYRRNSVARG
jgi:hypothetical protein